MDILIDYFPKSIMCEIYSYMGWYELYCIGNSEKSLAVSDNIWKPIYLHYFVENNLHFIYREKFRMKFLEKLESCRFRYGMMDYVVEHELMKFFQLMGEHDTVKFLISILSRKLSWIVKYISYALKNNREIFKSIVKINGKLLLYASSEICDDEEIIKLAIINEASSLNYASKCLKNNEELVKLAVKQRGSALSQASKRLRDNKDIVMSAISAPHEPKNPLYFASIRLKHDEEIINHALKHKYDLQEIKLFMNKKYTRIHLD